LFVYLKNTKLEFINVSLTQAYNSWQAKWLEVANLQFYNKDCTFIDLTKQVTLKDNALPYNNIPEDYKAKVFL